MKKVYIQILILVAVAFIGTLSSCRFRCVRGSGNQKTERRTVVNFTKIDISGGFKVTLKQDSSSVVSITADDNLLQYIKTSVDGGKLRIYTKKNMCNSGEMVVTIGVKNLEEIGASGAVEVYSDGRINTRDLSFDLSGSTKLNMDISAANVHTEGSGATEMVLKGQASSHDVNLSGSSNIDALDFVVGKYEIETSGASHVKINVLNNLSVHTSGSSEIQYRGNPASVNSDKSGASSITKIN